MNFLLGGFSFWILENISSWSQGMSLDSLVKAFSHTKSFSWKIHSSCRRIFSSLSKYLQKNNSHFKCQWFRLLRWKPLNPSLKFLCPSVIVSNSLSFIRPTEACHGMWPIIRLKHYAAWFMQQITIYSNQNGFIELQLTETQLSIDQCRKKRTPFTLRWLSWERRTRNKLSCKLSCSSRGLRGKFQARWASSAALSIP